MNQKWYDLTGESLNEIDLKNVIFGLMDERLAFYRTEYQKIHEENIRLRTQMSEVLLRVNQVKDELHRHNDMAESINETLKEWK